MAFARTTIAADVFYLHCCSKKIALGIVTANRLPRAWFLIVGATQKFVDVFCRIAPFVGFAVLSSIYYFNKVLTWKAILSRLKPEGGFNFGLRGVYRLTRAVLLFIESYV